MGPLNVAFGWSVQTEEVFAVLIGLVFGFFLEQGGFGNSRKLALVFYFRDMTVVKVMFTAILTAMTGWVLLAQGGLLDMESVALVPTYMGPAIAGGLIMGAGFAIGGYCPGTAVVGVATLKKDAYYNIGGAWLGMFLFSLAYPLVESFYLSGHMGDRVTLLTQFGWSAGFTAFLVVLMALGMFAGSEWLEKKFGEKEPVP